MNRDRFLSSYIETALWSSTDDDGTPLDSTKYSDTELAEETIKAMQSDCESFEKQASELIEAYRNPIDGDARTANYTARREQVAHDFWLTRNHHGAGFWGGDYPKPLGEQLTKLAHMFPERNLYIGDDG